MANNLVRAIGIADVMGGFERLINQIEGTVVYLVGTSTKYGVFLELGTSKMPAYPWLRPAVEEFKSNPESFVEQHSGRSVDEMDSANEVVESVALALQERMTQNVTAGSGGRSPGTHPDHPRRQTGNLAASIKAVRVR